MKISIVTINYNNLEGLKATMHSVFEQTYDAIEYIVIDGGSSDGSLALIGQFEKDLTYWVSEPDNGIYDALNKGIDKVTGAYVLFLNSGDSLHSKTVLEEFASLKTDIDLVYGNTLIVTGDKKEIKTMHAVSDLASSLSNTINHQSVFHHSRLFENNRRYSLAYPIIADWVFVNESVRELQARFKYVDFIVARYDGTGVSSNWDQIAKEREDYMEKTFSKDFRSVLKSYQTKVSEYNSFRNRPIVKALRRLKRVFKSK